MKRLVAQIQALVRELRRRRVIRVAVVCAGADFVFFQLFVIPASTIAESRGACGGGWR